MRPILLEMTGFVSFREPTQVCFDDTDYFALVGPTGSGKSTVIDALTFALYGSVPRWGHESMVAPALSPTTNRGVVRLLFDVSGTRYSVVRELRRSGRNLSVGVRNARLERFHNPTATGVPDDGTEVIAADSAVTPAVEALLALNFRQFCTCVALPQGEFAEFLQAKASDRQKMLINLLGLEIYEQISMRAGELARQHTSREQLLGEQLGGYADATEETIGQAARRVRELADLRSQVDAAVPTLRATAKRYETARATVTTLGDERVLLTALTVPSEVADLDEALRTAVAARDEASSAVAAAESADRAARAALRAAPDRHQLETIRLRQDELTEIIAALPRLVERVETAAVAERAADAAEKVANTEAGQAREKHDAVVRAAADLDEQADRLRADRDRLAALREPAGLAKVAAANDQAAAHLAEATARQGRAEAADTAAREEQASTPDATTLTVAVDAARDLHIRCAELTAAAADIERQEAQLEEARAELAAAVAARTDAMQAVEHADRADRAAALRAHLTVGAPCPVCEQNVHTLPDQAPDTDLNAANDVLARAERRHGQAEKAVRALERDSDRTADRQAAILDRVDQRRRALATAPLDDNLAEELAASGTDAARLAGAAAVAIESLTDVLRRRTELDARAKTAAADVAGARQAVTEARQEVEGAHGAIAAARAELRQARDQLAGLGAPVVDDADLSAGWRSLTEWASGRAADLSAELTAAEDVTACAAIEIQQAKQTWSSAEEGVARARATSREAIGELESARATLADRETRRDVLAGELADAPAAEAVDEQLGEISKLEQESREADRLLDAARQRAVTAAEAERSAQRQAIEFRQALDRARDPLVRLGAPAVTGAELLADWSALVEWATVEADRRDKELGAATRAADELAAEVRAVEQNLVADFAGHSVPVELDTGQEIADAVPVVVATAWTEAVEAHKTLEQRARAAATMAADIQSEREQAQVAKQVADLLRSNNFPRWLVAGALDGLVTTASTALLELSGGQFELTHSDGEFLVVDHNEADATRSVKTLSGGETFQASLALALALSTQIGALAASGAARLDAIFLDEGFGTLDESTLDTVAATLENLACSGSRMVGVVTHVPTLAERVPVRFRVTRDSAGSHIVKEDV